jgi:endonuclease YncB( thermonuclease family)
MRVYGIIAAAIVLTTATSTHAATITGTPYIIDGDSLDFDRKEEIRLYGIDAPELHQACVHDGREWSCGRSSRNQLRKLIDNQPVRCEAKDHDRYGRNISICTIQRDGKTIDLNREMVATGWAFAYRHYTMDYAPEEDAAIKAKSGMWDSDVMPPWDWRKLHPWHKKSD